MEKEQYQCDECGISYEIHHEENQKPEYCPFCKEENGHVKELGFDEG